MKERDGIHSLIFCCCCWNDMVNNNKYDYHYGMSDVVSTYICTYKAPQDLKLFRLSVHELNSESEHKSMFPIFHKELKKALSQHNLENMVLLRSFLRNYTDY